MGRPINDRFLGDFVAKSGFQVSAVVHVDAGEGPEPGNILRQRSNNKYLVEGVNSGEQLVCKLVAELEPALGEMSVSVFSDEKGLVTLIENQDETDYDGSGDNGTFDSGASHSTGDILTLSNGASITVDDVAVPTQTFTVVSVPNPDTQVGGAIYQVDGVNKPVLNLVRGGVYTFDQSDASNNNHPIAFRDSSDNPFTTGVVSTGTPGQAGAQTVFTVPVNAPSDLRYYCTVHGNGMGNVINVTGTGAGGVVTEFTVTDGGDPVTAGSTLTQASTDGSGTGFELTIDADNDEPLPEFARNINNRTVKTFLGNVYAWPVNADVTSRTDINIQGQ